MSRRPALTDAVVGGLDDAVALLTGDWEMMTRDETRPPEEVARVGRAIQYLEALIAWHRRRRTADHG